MNSSFRIDYQNLHRSVDQPELYESYDVVSAYYDYQPAGPAATLVVCDYELELEGRLLINWLRESLSLAERLIVRSPDDWSGLRLTLPTLPKDSSVHLWMAADIASEMPVLAFVRVGERVLIYTRTSAGIGGPSLMLLARDRELPCDVPLVNVVSAIADCLTHYLNDLVAAFPFLLTDEAYLSQRERIAALLLLSHQAQLPNERAEHSS